MNNNSFQIPHGKKLILFDGVCNFCNYWVNFIMERDINDLFRFASLQSEFGQSILKKINLSTEDFDTFVLLEDEQYFIKSTAALKIVRNLSGALKLIYPLIIMPKFLRDLLYTIIAKYRYRIFGKSESCRIPTEAEKAKFLE